MNDYNKKSLTQGAVILTAAFVAFFTIISFYYCVYAGAWWAMILPAVGVGYGIFNFIKKYYPKD